MVIFLVITEEPETAMAQNFDLIFDLASARFTLSPTASTSATFFSTTALARSGPLPPIPTTGTVLTQTPIPDGLLTEDRLCEALSGYRGEIDQVPPMYSALKKDGKKLYELARAGKTVEREPRRVSELVLLEDAEPVEALQSLADALGQPVVAALPDEEGDTEPALLITPTILPWVG